MVVKLDNSLGTVIKSTHERVEQSLITVNSVVIYYVNNILESLLRDRVVTITGITTLKIIYDTVDNEYFVRGRVSSTLKNRYQSIVFDGESGGKAVMTTDLVYDIAEKLNLPVLTVDTILRVFTEELIKRAQHTGLIVLPGITTIRLVQNDGELVTRGRVAPSLQSKLKLLDTAI